MKDVFSAEFRKYGRVLTGYDFEEVLSKLEKTPLPNDVIYVRKDAQLEDCKLYEQMKNKMYGESDIQFGYCNGHNKKLNALEYHRSSEVNVAGTDMVLMLGKQYDIADDFTYDTSKVECFLVPKNVAVEIYATTLHYAPCNVGNEGFRCLVIFPDNTNEELANVHTKLDVTKPDEDSLLAANNKWLIAHEDANIEGAFNGLKGINITMED